MNESPSPTLDGWLAIDADMTPERRRHSVDASVAQGLPHVAYAVLELTKRFVEGKKGGDGLLREVEATVQELLDCPDQAVALARASGMLRYLMENGSYVADLAPLRILKQNGVQQPGMSLVDLGTGSGGVVKAWSQEGPAMGFDVSPSFVQASELIEYGVIDGDSYLMRKKAHTLLTNPRGHTVLSSLTLDRVARPGQLIDNMSTLAGDEGNVALFTLLPIVPEDDEAVGKKIIYTPHKHRITDTGTEAGDKAVILEYLEDTHGALFDVIQDTYTVKTTTGSKTYPNYYGFIGRRKTKA